MTKTTEKKLREEFEKELSSKCFSGDGIYHGDSVWNFIDTAIKEAVEEERERIRESIYKDDLLEEVIDEMNNTPRDKFPDKVQWDKQDPPKLNDKRF